MSQPRPIWAACRFVKTWGNLSQAHRAKVIEFLIAFPDLMDSPHGHSGVGFRRLQGTFFYEARLDLRWRLVLRVSPEEIVLFDVKNHDQVRRL